jgi:HK97 family phage major capsid protein
MTKEDLEKLIKEQAKDLIAEEGYIKADELQEKIEEATKEKLTDEMEAHLDAKIAELANTPKEDKEKDKIAEKEKPFELDAKGGYEYFAEFAKDVYDSGKPGAGTSPKLAKWLGDVNEYNRVAKTAGTPTLELGDPEQGGYLVPTEFSTKLLMNSIEQSDFFSKATKVPMKINSIDIPYVQDDTHAAGKVYKAVQLYWLDELGTKLPSKPKFGKVNLRLNKLIGLAYASDEILEDSPISLEPLLGDIFGKAFTFMLDNAALNGTGAGQPRGILNELSTITVGAEAGQAANTIVAENIIKMYARMYPGGHKNAVWVANPDTFSQLATMSLAVGTGGIPVWMPAGGISGKPYDTLMGKPLIFSEHCQTLGDLGDIYYIDWTQYLVGQKAGRAGLSYATSIHLMFLYDQTAFRWVMRIDGQGWWPTDVTPRYSADTISPFIMLEAR